LAAAQLRSPSRGLGFLEGCLVDIRILDADIRLPDRRFVATKLSLYRLAEVFHYVEAISDSAGVVLVKYCGMKKPPDPHYRHRFPAELICHTVWLYHLFSLSFRDVELLLSEPGVFVSYETSSRTPS
jgi:hypothetical protein